MTARQARDVQLRCDECGFTTKRTTQGIAEYGLRRHSCETTRKRERWHDKAEARRGSSGVKRECEHKVANHQHGTRQAYVLDRCRCRPCRNAATAYNNDVAKQQAYGTWDPFVDAGPTRAHLAGLAEAGLGYKRVAKLAGVTESVLGSIIYGRIEKNRERPPTRRIRKHTADKVLAVQVSLEVLGQTICVDPTGTIRRLQALVANGWSQARLNREYGSTSTVHGVLARGTPVHAETARKVKALYDRLWDQAPPENTHKEKIAASRARNIARSRGWLPPLAWDDDSIDDPGAWGNVTVEDDLFDEVMVERLVAAFPRSIWRDARATREDRLEAAHRLDAIGRRAVAHLSLREQADSTTAVASRNKIEAALGLKQGRDFGLVTLKKEIAS